MLHQYLFNLYSYFEVYNIGFYLLWHWYIYYWLESGRNTLCVGQ